MQAIFKSIQILMLLYVLGMCYCGPIAVRPGNLPLQALQTLVEPPKPYEFGYQSIDEVGTNQHRQETSDGNVVKGSYGYVDPLGMYRTVQYVADINGYRAVVSTNEPGTSSGTTGNTVYFVQPPPPAALLWQDPKFVL